MIRTRIAILLLLIITSFIPGIAQKILLEESPGVTNTKDNWGPNRKHYIQTTAYNLQFLPIGEDLIDLRIAQNQAWGIMVQYKRRLNSVFSLVAAAVYNTDRFSFKTDQASIINMNEEYNKEFLKMQTLGYNERIRLNLNKRRGNHLGKYIDLGFFSEYLIMSRHIGHIPANKSVDGFKNTKIIESGLDYLNPFQYGVIVQFGIDNLGIYYKGKLSKWIADNTIAGNLPVHQIGLNYAIMH